MVGHGPHRRGARRWTHLTGTHRVDCARTLPFGPALAVADSALRSGSVTRSELRHLAACTRSPGIEADGYGVHGTRRAFAADLARHDDLQTEDWVTRRFAFEHVMRRPGWVGRQALAAAAQRLVPQPQRHIRRAIGRNKAA